EVDENFKAYKVGEHRHQPEIQEQLSLLAGETVGLVFTPHLLPLRRGILSTIYCTVGGKITESDLFALWNRYYHHEPWVRIHSSGSLPELKWVLGSNFCDMGMKKVDEKHLVVVSVIDNLTKGASGQAVQNMNVMFGIDERIGLPDSVLYP
ncbi:MAG: Asd/ArgC dimerization domain-containing protein, partial [Atribacterota bacterium]